MKVSPLAASPIDSMRAKGQWLRRYKQVGPSDVIDSVSTTSDIVRKPTITDSELFKNS
jgi:hypothetical protein